MKQIIYCLLSIVFLSTQAMEKIYTPLHLQPLLMQTPNYFIYSTYDPATQSIKILTHEEKKISFRSYSLQNAIETAYKSKLPIQVAETKGIALLEDSLLAPSIVSINKWSHAIAITKILIPSFRVKYHFQHFSPCKLLCMNTKHNKTESLQITSFMKIGNKIKKCRQIIDLDISGPGDAPASISFKKQMQIKENLKLNNIKLNPLLVLPNREFLYCAYDTTTNKINFIMSAKQDAQIKASLTINPVLDYSSHEHVIVKGLALINNTTLALLTISRPKFDSIVVIKLISKEEENITLEDCTQHFENGKVLEARLSQDKFNSNIIVTTYIKNSHDQTVVKLRYILDRDSLRKLQEPHELSIYKQKMYSI